MKNRTFYSGTAIMIGITLAVLLSWISAPRSVRAGSNILSSNRMVHWAGGIAEGYNAPTSGETFTVNSNSDASDNNIGDCLCKIAGGDCTLRAAIQEANACSGAQTINFASPMKITVGSALPILTDDKTDIDATDQRVEESGVKRPGVILDGANTAINGIVIHGSNNYVRGLTIKRFTQYGIILENGAQSNWINTNVVSACLSADCAARGSLIGKVSCSNQG